MLFFFFLKFVWEHKIYIFSFFSFVGHIYRVKMEADESYEFTLVCSAPGYALRSGSGKFQHHKIWSKRHIDLFVDAFSSQKVRRGAGVMEKKVYIYVCIYMCVKCIFPPFNFF